MLIKYKFANGDVSVVEVSEEIGKEIEKSRKKEHANNEKQRYHCYSITETYEGTAYASNETMEEIFDSLEDDRHFYEVLSKLTPTQQRRLMLFAAGVASREIARREGLDHTTIIESIEAAKKKFKKFY